MMYVSQIIMVYMLNLYGAIYQLYPNKLEEKIKWNKMKWNKIK